MGLLPSFTCNHRRGNQDFCTRASQQITAKPLCGVSDLKIDYVLILLCQPGRAESLSYQRDISGYFAMERSIAFADGITPPTEKSASVSRSPISQVLLLR